MKPSDLTLEYIENFMRLDEPTDTEKAEVQALWDAAVDYVEHYTGLASDDFDSFEDITTAILVLIIDMFDNRNKSLDKAQYSNKTVDCILGMHDYNLL